MRILKIACVVLILGKCSVAHFGMANPFSPSDFPTPPLPPMPPMPPSGDIPAYDPSAPLPEPAVVTTVVTAYWPPYTPVTGTEQGFFQESFDSINWMTISRFPYPTNGAWVTITNVGSSAPQLFFRAGSQP